MRGLGERSLSICTFWGTFRETDRKAVTWGLQKEPELWMCEQAEFPFLFKFVFGFRLCF